MLSGVFNLHEQQVREVMTPIPAVVTVDVSETVEEGMRRCITSGHSRLLVTEDHDPDRVVGIVHANQLAKRLLDVGPAPCWPASPMRRRSCLNHGPWTMCSPISSATMPRWPSSPMSTAACSAS